MLYECRRVLHNRGLFCNAKDIEFIQFLLHFCRIYCDQKLNSLINERPQHPSLASLLFQRPISFRSWFYQWILYWIKWKSKWEFYPKKWTWPTIETKKRKIIFCEKTSRKKKNENNFWEIKIKIVKLLCEYDWDCIDQKVNGHIASDRKNMQITNETPPPIS